MSIYANRGLDQCHSNTTVPEPQRQDQGRDRNGAKKLDIVRAGLRRRLGQETPRQKTAIAQKRMTGAGCPPIAVGLFGVVDQPLGQFQPFNERNPGQNPRKPKDIRCKDRAHRSGHNIDAAERPETEPV